MQHHAALLSQKHMKWCSQECCHASSTSLHAEQQVWRRMQVRYLVMAEEAYRASLRPAFLSDAQVAAYKELCATLKSALQERRAL